MDVRFRAHEARDFDYAPIVLRHMRWAIERVFGWDQAHQEESFAVGLSETRSTTVGTDKNG